VRKNDLIRELNKLKGNLEICFWNGHVGDWQHFDGKIHIADAVKQPFEYYVDKVKYEMFRDKLVEKFEDIQFTEEEMKDLRKSYMKDITWNFNPYVTEEHIEKGYYKTKVMYMLQTKQRGQEYFDRQGSMEYRYALFSRTGYSRLQQLSRLQ
jgi:hypothetical protein